MDFVDGKQRCVFHSSAFHISFFTFISLRFWLYVLLVPEKKRRSIQKSMPVIRIQNEPREGRNIKKRRSVKSTTVRILIKKFWWFPRAVYLIWLFCFNFLDLFFNGIYLIKISLSNIANHFKLNKTSTVIYQSSLPVI